MSAALLDLVHQRIYPLRGDTLKIGREACDIVLDDSSTSRLHAVLLHRDGKWWLEDKGSTNGSTVDGHKLTANEPVALRFGNCLVFGTGSRFQLVEQGADALAAAGDGTEIDLSELMPSEGHGFATQLEAMLFRAQSALWPLQPAETLHHALVELALLFVPATRGALLLRAQDGQLLTAAALASNGDSLRDLSDFRISRTVVQKLMQDRRALLVTDVAHSELGRAESLVIEQVTSAAAVPLFDGEAIHGVLYVDMVASAVPLGRDDLSLLCVLGSMGAAAVVAARAYAELLKSEQALREELARRPK